MDFEAEGLLAGLEGEAREQRVELLEWLCGEGFGPDDLRRSHQEGLTLFVAAAREVVGERRFSAAEVAERAGVEADGLVRIMRAQGLPVGDGAERRFTEVDVEAARTAAQLRELGISDDQMVTVARVAGRGLAQLAETMRAIPMEAVLEPGLSEVEMARRYRDAVRLTMPLVGPLIEQMLRQHLDNMVRTEAIDAAELEAGRLTGARDMTVAFADLVGFTRLGEEIPPDELGAVADRLVAMAGDVFEPPGRIVKTIGDAVLVVSPDTEGLVGHLLGLIDVVAAEGADFPQVRVGVAAGTVLPRAGDVFGRPVNLASRVTGVARAGSVLATRDVRDAAREAFRWSSAGTRRLKGVPEPVPLYRARAIEP